MERYAEYKDSGVEWIGGIPAGWRVERLKAGAKLINIKSTDSRLPILGMDAVESWTGRVNSTSEQQDAGDGQLNQCGAGDILFGKLRPYLAKVAKAESPMNCSSEFLVLRPQCYSADFLRYSLLNARLIDAVNATAYGTKMPRASWETVGNLRLPLPCMAEQRAVAAYLDEKTAKVDGLIADTERSIELLREYRSSVISEAVTKGLDPSAPMKDSDVELIGEIPAHWEAGCLKHFVHFLSGFAFKGEDIANGGPCSLFRGINLGVGHTGNDDVASVSNDVIAGLDAYLLNVGDLVIGLDRPWVSGGMRRAFITEKDAPCYLVQRVAKASVITDEYDALYLFFLLDTQVVSSGLQEMTTGISVPHISTEQLGNLTVPKPPLDEQQAIAAYLDSQTSAIDSLIADKRAAIDRLREYRKSLISEAVTGKFRVPGVE